jgi:prepilin-type N-terminal cleavage/methylation domain-containing protein
MKTQITTPKRKRQSGFTLVEVIVVAVIVAILAGVSVPLYLNYIENSRLNQANNAAGSAASFLAACRNGGGSSVAGIAGTVDPTTVLTCGSGTGDGTTITIPNGIQLTTTGTFPAAGTVQACYYEDGACVSPLADANTYSF